MELNLSITLICSSCNKYLKKYFSVVFFLFPEMTLAPPHCLFLRPCPLAFYSSDTVAVERYKITTRPFVLKACRHVFFRKTVPVESENKL